MIVATPKIMRDPDTGLSKGFGFVSYETFEASDAAIDAMNNQFLMNRSVLGNLTHISPSRKRKQDKAIPLLSPELYYLHLRLNI